jgi:predicted dehydrogenase
MADRRLRYGMVGGGPGAFIGEVHRRAIALDGLAELAAGAFSTDADRSRAHGAALGLDADRVYPSFAEMAEREAGRGGDDRLDVVVVVAPNHVHYDACRAFVERGFNVVCDKPLTTTLEDAEALARLVREAGVVFAVTHNYGGYPMVKQARAMVLEGRLGQIRRVSTDYTQGWLATRVEADGSKQAEWRTDPARAGAGALGDIGSHAWHLARYVSGLEIERMCADVSTIVTGRQVDDDASILMHYENGARGILTCSQVAAGDRNALRLRVWGEEGGLEWNQEEPETLTFRPRVGPAQIFARGADDLSSAARHASRLPVGHPEAFLEAFANVYGNILRTIAARKAGRAPDPLDADFPTVEDGARGVHFIQTALESGKKGGWVDARYGAGDW